MYLLNEGDVVLKVWYARRQERRLQYMMNEQDC